MSIDDKRQTNRLLYPLLCMRARGVMLPTPYLCVNTSSGHNDTTKPVTNQISGHDGVFFN